MARAPKKPATTEPVVDPNNPNAVTSAEAPKKAKTIDLPSIGDVVLYRENETTLRPLIVTELLDAVFPENDEGEALTAGFSGQAFLGGTETRFVERATFGDAVGQAVSR